MQATRAKQEFRQYLHERGLDLESITPAQGIDSMLAFYRDVRADGCVLEDDDDMLLFQWGTYDWSQGEHFSFNITRQLITGEAEDDDIWQLSLDFKFPPSEALTISGSGNRWCNSLAKLDDLKAFIVNGAAHRSVAHRDDAEVTLEYECAG